MEKIHRLYKQLRELVIEAWNAVTDKQVKGLIESMYDRYQDVIDAKGWHTKILRIKN